MKIKNSIIFGTRPEAKKMAPLVKESQKYANSLTKVCITAQHQEMLDQVLDFFQMTPVNCKNIGKAQKINNYKSFWCAENVQTATLEFELKHSRKPRIALMGLAFKPNIDDLRESPAKYIVQKVFQNTNNEEYDIVEPNIKGHNVFKIANYKEAVDKSDIFAFLFAHNEFKTFKVSTDKGIFDFSGVIK